MKRITLAVTALFVLNCRPSHAADVSILKYGARGDGITLNTNAIQQAIDEVNRTGGGKVIFPAGNFLSGTVVLKDNVTLHFDKGSTLLGSTKVEDYRNMDPFNDGLGTEVGWALLVAVDAKNIALEGEGAINGQGSKLKEEQVRIDTRPESQRWGRRPFLLRIVRCEGVSVKGVTLLYSAAWTSHYFHSKHISIQQVKILSRGVPHNDGIDIDGCQDVRIRDCDIESGDDALCFKTTSSKMACSDIVVNHMRLKSSQGAIKMGTESMAPFENIKISDCYIYNTNNGGIKLLSVDGAHLRNVEISDITMVEVKTPILVRLGARLSVFRKASDTRQSIGSLDHVVIRNVKAKSADTTQLVPASGILITGIPGHPVTNLTLENIDIQLPGGGTEMHARQTVPEAEDKYPEVKTFGPTIPAYGVWARHVEALTLKNVRVQLAGNDLRPAVICEDGKKVQLSSCQFPGTVDAESVIRLVDVQFGVVNEIRVDKGARSFVRVEGGRSSDIRISNDKQMKVDKVVELGAGIKAGVVSVHDR